MGTKMKKSTILFCILLTAISVAISADDNSGFVPENSVVFVTVSRMRDDDGMKWLRQSWHDSPRESTLRDFFNKITYHAVSVAVLPSVPGGKPKVLLIAVVDNGADLNLNYMDNVISSETTSSVKSSKESGTELRYVDNPDPENDYGAYAVVGNSILFGADKAVVEEALSGSPVAETPNFIQMTELLDVENDGLLFADNRDTRFADFLNPLESKWGLSLLLSSQDLAWMGSSFDVVDLNTVKGKIIFHTEDDSAIFDVQDDAEFLGEAFRRKFIAENIEYSSEVQVEGTTVTLEFEIEGLKSLWLRLFEGGVLSIIQPN